MGFVGQYPRPSAAVAGSSPFPGYVGVASFVLTTVTFVVIVFSLITRPELSDPFSAFSDLLGDDAWQAALARGFTCHHTDFTSDHPIASDYCVQFGTGATFSGIYVHISGSSADEMSFWMRENRLTLGDLVLLWGKPDIWQSCETLIASWPIRHIMAFTAPSRARHVSLFLPVISVSFTSGGPPQTRRLLLNDATYPCG